ncbi:MAG: hypothetical protein DRN71_04405 [Candidatus Nanohalarchaeota archaeon]|nr:MAG: hypothetical protein DRN71_04405 [Candidatus Nanohaloarchaeota archaeon]
MTDYETAIKRPVQDIKKLAIGCVLNVVPVVNFIVTGYILKAAKKTMKKRNDLPEWNAWGDLFMTGLLAIGIVLIYSLPGLALLFAGFGAMVFGVIAGGASVNMSMALAGGTIMIAVTLLLLVSAMFVAPMAVMHYIDKGDFSAAFAIKSVFKKSVTADYGVAWVVMLIYGSAIMYISMMVPYVGIAIGGYIIGLTAVTVFAGVYSKR